MHKTKGPGVYMYVYPHAYTCTIYTMQAPHNVAVVCDHMYLTISNPCMSSCGCSVHDVVNLYLLCCRVCTYAHQGSNLAAPMKLENDRMQLTRISCTQETGSGFDAQQGIFVTQFAVSEQLA